MKFSDFLESIEACMPAVNWVGSRTSAEAWEECKQADWMVWLLRRMVGQPGWPDLRTVIGILVDCAETIEHLGPPEARECNQTTRRWIAGEASDDELIMAIQKTESAARKAAHAARKAARLAAHAARKAARLAGYAEDVAARTSGDYGAHMAKMADMIREKIPTIPEV